MAILALIPIALVVGRYTLGAVAACAIGYFTVRFWTVLWAMAAWMDETLTTMFAGNQTLAGGSFGPNDTALTFARYATSMTEYQMESVVMLTTAALFFGLPMVFTMVLGWAGVQGIGALNEGMKGMMAATDSAGQRADSTSRAVAGAAAGAAVGVAGAPMAAGMATQGARAATGAVVQGVQNAVRGSFQR